MYAIVRDSQFNPEGLAHGQAELDRFQSLHASQPGYVGSVLVDAGEGRVLIVTIWQDQQHATRGRDVLGPQVQELLGPIMTRESRIVGTGPVLATDLEKRS
jgi:heme-degrading monooxygenase HmoA